MYELQWLAFQADLTRVVTFMLGRELNFRTYPEIGLTQGASHDVAPPGAAREHRAVREAQYVSDGPVRVVLEQARNDARGRRHVARSFLFLYGGAFGNPNLHAHIDLPLALVGGPAGRLGGGRHQVEPSGTPLSNLLLTMLDGADVRIESLGDSTGRVALGDDECVTFAR